MQYLNESDKISWQNVQQRSDLALPLTSSPPCSHRHGRITHHGGSLTKSITVTQWGLSYGASSQFQHQADSLQAQAWEQKIHENPGKAPGAQTRKKEGKNCIQGWSGLCSQCQHKLHSGRTAVLALAVNAQEQGLLFCPFAKYFNTCTQGASARWRAMRQWQAGETAYHRAALLMFSDEQQRELQGGLSFHLPVSPLDRVSRLLLISLYSSPSPLLNSIMPSLNLCM